jgi:Protein of unknown function (DUF2892)
MKTNVGSIDRILRIVVGLALIGATLSGAIGLWGWIGLVPLLTGALSTCPVYTLLGFSSCPVKAQ